MKQNRLVLAITFLSFLAQAQTTTTTGTIGTIANSVSSITGNMAGLPNNVFPQNSLPLQLQSATTRVQTQLLACQGKVLPVQTTVDEVKKKFTTEMAAAKAKSDAKHGKTKKDGGSSASGECYDSKYEGGSFNAETDCELTCSPPPVPSDPTCSSFTKQSKRTTDSVTIRGDGTRDVTPDGGRELSCQTPPNITESTSYNTAIRSESTYQNFLAFKANSCASKAYDEYQAQAKAFDCQMGVLAQAVREASNQVQTTLTSNNAQFGKMVQFQQELGSQISQIDEILTGDPTQKGAGGQFGGLLGLQKDLHAQLANLNNQQADFQNQVTQLQTDTTSNEQTLISDQMAVVGSCLSGQANLNMAGAYTLTCNKPRLVSSKDANGNAITTQARAANGTPITDQQPCGPTEFLSAEVESGAYLSSGRMVVTDDRRQQAQQNVAQVQSLMQAIQKSLGSQDPTNKNGDKILVTTATTWADVEKTFGAQMDALTKQSGVDIRGQLRSIGGHCFNDSVTWKRQQQLSASSNYNLKKTELKKTQTALAAQLNTGISSLNKDYGDMMAVLTGSVVSQSSKSRVSCTTTDPTAMSTCFSNIRQGVQNLLEGNDSVPFTSKAITGGTMVAGFSIPCRGIDGCVTSMNQVRDAAKKQSLMAQQQKTKYVNDGNQQVQSQVQAFSQFLGNVQNVVLGKFKDMNETLAKMKVAGPEQPKFLDPESLEQSQTVGPPKELGPYKVPQKMANVFSSMVQPTGLIDFSSPGVREGEKSAIEKLSKDKVNAKEAAEKAAEVSSKLSSLADSCVQDAKCSNDIGRDPTSITPADCESQVNQCMNSSDNKVTSDDTLLDNLSELTGALDAYYSNTKDESKVTAVQANVSKLNLRGKPKECTEIKLACANLSETKNPNATHQRAEGEKDGKTGF